MKLIAWTEFPDWSTKSTRPGGLVSSLSGADGASGSRRLMSTISRAQHKDEEVTETRGGILGSPWGLQLTEPCARENDPRTTRKDEREQSPKAHTGWKWLLLFPPIRVGNLIINKTSGRVFSRVLPQEVIKL